MILHHGYIATNSILTMQQGENFISLLNDIAHRPQESTVQLMALSTAFSRRSPDSALSDIRQRDINIIFGFFGPEIARHVLCRVSC